MEVSCDLSEVFSMFIELYEFVFVLPAPDVMQFIGVRARKLTILLVWRAEWTWARIFSSVGRSSKIEAAE